MPRLAIVITTAGSIEALEGTLVSVLENRPADCEVVVALSQKYDDPYDLKDEVRFLPPVRRRSTIEAVNAALGATRAPLVHLLAAGCLVNEGWTDVALQRFGDRRTAAVVPLVLNAEDSGRIVAAGVGYRDCGQRFLVGSGQAGLDATALEAVRGPCLFAAFYRKAALDLVGGFSRQLGPRQADVDLALILEHAGFGVAVEHGCCVRAGSEVDAAAGSFGEALGDERLFWRNSGAVRQPSARLGHAALVAGELGRCLVKPTNVARVLGRACGLLLPGGYARHRQNLAALAARALPARPESGDLRFDRSHGVLLRREKAQRRSTAS